MQHKKHCYTQNHSMNSIDYATDIVFTSPPILNIVSITNEPVRTDAIDGDITVITGKIAFLSACLNTTWLGLTLLLLL